MEPGSFQYLQTRLSLTEWPLHRPGKTATSFSCSWRRKVLLLVIRRLRSSTKVTSATMTTIKRPPTTQTASVDWPAELWEQREPKVPTEMLGVAEGWGHQRRTYLVHPDSPGPEHLQHTHTKTLRTQEA